MKLESRLLDKSLGSTRWRFVLLKVRIFARRADFIMRLNRLAVDVSVLRHVDQATPNGAKRRRRSASPTSRRWRQSNTRPCTPLGCKCCLGIVTQGALRDPGLRCSTALRLS